tara:strand:+ start:577 stop:774 length:198 start_codon:yes stop_codon:yes gene_type:complete
MKYKETNGYFRKGTSFNDAMKLAVTPTEAFNEVLGHYREPNDFVEDEGDLPEYTGKQILDWLGYN